MLTITSFRDLKPVHFACFECIWGKFRVFKWPRLKILNTRYGEKGTVYKIDIVQETQTIYKTS